MKEKMIEEQEDHIRELDRERQRKLRDIKSKLESVEKIQEYGIIGETVERFYRNTGAIENEVPPPPSEDKSTEFPSEIVNTLDTELKETVWSSVSTELSDVAIDELNDVNPSVCVISIWDEPLTKVGRDTIEVYGILSNSFVLSFT